MPNISDIISETGKNLAAALYRIQQEDEYNLIEISRKLNSFLPEFVEVLVDNDKANKQFIIKLRSNDGRIFNSQVLSEGTLRILALCVLLFDDKHKSLLCFEEPENGIHPGRIQTIATLLKDLCADFSFTENPFLRQVIVNTHSAELVSQMNRWRSDSTVSVGVSRLVSFIGEQNGIKIKNNISEIIIANKELDLGLLFPDRRESLTTINNNLQSSPTNQ